MKRVFSLYTSEKCICRSWFRDRLMSQTVCHLDSLSRTRNDPPQDLLRCYIGKLHATFRLQGPMQTDNCTQGKVHFQRRKDTIWMLKAPQPYNFWKAVNEPQKFFGSRVEIVRIFFTTIEVSRDIYCYLTHGGFVPRSGWFVLHNWDAYVKTPQLSSDEFKSTELCRLKKANGKEILSPQILCMHPSAIVVVKIQPLVNLEWVPLLLITNLIQASFINCKRISHQSKTLFLCWGSWYTPQCCTMVHGQREHAAVKCLTDWTT